MSNASSTGTVPSVDALAALYQAERTDAVGILSAALALIAAGLAYIGVTLTLSDGLMDWRESGAMLLLPFPLMMICAFHSLLTITSMVRAQSIERIEDDLVALAGLAGVRGKVGISASERIMNITVAGPAHRFATALTYGGTGLILIGYGVYCCYQGLQGTGLSTGWIFAVVIYFLLVVGIAWSWFDGFRVLKELSP